MTILEDSEEHPSISTHVEFYKLNNSLVFLMKSPISKDLYEILENDHKNILLSYQNNCAFLPTDDTKKTIKDVYMTLRKPENQVYGIHLMEGKANPIYYAIENDYLSQNGYKLEPYNSPLLFKNSADETDITITLLKSSIEIKCIDRLKPHLDKIGLEFDPQLRSYVANHTLIDDLIHTIFNLFLNENLSDKITLFKNSKPNFPANFRDSYRADIFFHQLFGSNTNEK